MNAPAAVLMGTPIVLAAAIVPGGAWVLVAGRGTRSRAEAAGTALALSPGLYGGAIALLLAAGLPLRSATAFALAFFALAAGAATVLRRRRRAPGRSGAPADGIAWIVAVVVTALVALFPLCSEWWRVYSDAWNHAGITRAVVLRGAHPLDPFFAGLPLQYPWIYHAQAASVSAATGANVYALMSLWGAIALLALLLCAGPLAQRLHGRAQGWSLVLLVLGLNAAWPLFAPVLAGRALTGEVRGWPELVRSFSLLPFGVSSVTHLLQEMGGLDFFLNKFMVTTPFAFGLAAYTALLASLLRRLDGGGRGELWIAAGAALAAGLMHPVIALAVIPSALGLLALTWIAPRATGLSRGGAAVWAAAVVAGTVPVVLYTVRIMGGEGGSHRELPVDLTLWKWLGLYSTLALGLVLALRPALGMLRAGGPRGAWVAWLALQLGIATVIRLPGGTFNSIDKFAYFVWIPLALTGGAALAAWMESRGALARAVLVIALFVPVNGLALAGRVGDPHASARQPWGLAGYAWMRAHLPADAVLLLPYGDPVTGNFAGRDEYISDEPLGLQLGYPAREIAARRELTERFWAADSLLPADDARLRALRVPVYAVWTDFADPRLAVTPRLGWSGLEDAVLPPRPPHWEGRYRIVYASGTHVVAELVPAGVAEQDPRAADPVAVPR